MNITELPNKALLENILPLKQPWCIERVDLQKANKVVDVIINFTRGSLFACPCCQNMCKVHDSTYQRARYLDLFEYRTYLQVKVPRTHCQTCGVKTIKHNGFFRPSYCFSFEEKIMRMVTGMSVREVAILLGEADNNIWRVLHHYVD